MKQLTTSIYTYSKLVNGDFLDKGKEMEAIMDKSIMKKLAAAKHLYFFIAILILFGLSVPAFLFTRSKVDDSSPPPLFPIAGAQNNEKENKQKNEDSQVTEWERPRINERKQERRRMIETQVSGRGIECDNVLEAMRHVPRHLFVPEAQKRHAYADRPLPIGYGQTISQPYIVAYMTDKLSVKPTDNALEIGTGSGYQAAVLGELTPNVFSIEIIEKLAAQGENNLKNVGYDMVEVQAGDGYFGWEKHAPFDKIIVTAAAGHVPPPLIEQLAPGGKMIIPVGSPYETQYMILFQKDEDGEVTSEHLLPVRFVPMTGHIEEH